MFGEEFYSAEYLATKSQMNKVGFILIAISIIAFLILIFFIDKPRDQAISKRKKEWDRTKFEKVTEPEEIGKSFEPKTFFRKAYGFNISTIYRPATWYYLSLVACFIGLFIGIGMIVIGPHAAEGFLAACFIHTGLAIALHEYLRVFTNYRKNEKDPKNMNEDELRVFKKANRKEHVIYYSTLLLFVIAGVKYSIYLYSLL